MHKLSTLVAAAALAATAPLLISGPAGAAGGARHYPNCAALHRVYPHGVGLAGARDHVSSGRPVTNFVHRPKVYNANKGLDRDHDYIACEQH